ncbi:MAG: hypothetical protein JXQ27_15785, partial [Acidobacteria bacterium]|nr:hypothetical protein [Acidobacteriota bacterium]
MHRNDGIRLETSPVRTDVRAGRLMFILFLFLMLLPFTGVAECTPDETTLCLQNGRFEITLEWTDFAGNEYSLFGVGQSGDARFVKRSEDTGLFWFFSEDNVEGIVRILDGRSVNGYFWVFAAFMTNMDPELRVTDMDTGAVRSYASGGGFPMPILDTDAFADAIETDVEPPSPRQAAALRRMLALARHAGEESPDGPNWAKRSLPPTRPGRKAGVKLVPSCQDLPSVLCFDENRFRVEAAWEYDNGTTQSGVASAVSLPGDQSGAFWFFNEDNIEMLVKVLDGRHVNDHFWIFAAGLTNVKTTLVVTDTLTGQSFQRTTYPGYAMPPLYDNEAFHHGWRNLAGVHITSQPPWSNVIDVFNTGNQNEYFYMETYNADGTFVDFQGYDVAAGGWTRLVMDNNQKYIPGPDDIILDPVEGWFWILVAEPTLQAKVSYQYGDSPSVTEFFLPDATGWEYLLTNPRQPHFSWFAAAVTNTLGYPVRVEFEAYQQGVLQGSTQTWLEPWNKYARLSDGIIADLGYDDFDMLRIRSEVGPIPPPISITGNDAQDRHV